MAKRKSKAKPKQAIVRREPPGNRWPLADAIEKVLLQGDLSVLTVEQRLQYYKSLCNSLGLNPLTKPFDYLNLSGKLVLYAKRDCTDQLRKIYGVSVTRLETKTEDGMCIAKVEVRDKNGRTDAASGAVYVEQLRALDLANAIMKAETKAKRRATLSICGMGMLDESELDTISDKHFVTDGGRIIHEAGGSRDAAQAVGRRVAEEKRVQIENRRVETTQKPENAIRGDSRPPNGKDGQSVDGRQESLTLTPWHGKLALSGNGLSIVRAEMSEDDKAFFGIKYDGRDKVFFLEEKLAFKFQDLCARLKVKVVFAENASGIPRAVIPAWEDPLDLESKLEKRIGPLDEPSTDPILFETKMIEKAGKKPFMDLNWSGRHHSCFDKGLWPILTAATGQPVMLETKENGKYSNLVRIVRVDGMNFGDEQNQQREPGED